MAKSLELATETRRELGLEPHAWRVKPPKTELEKLRARDKAKLGAMLS